MQHSGLGRRVGDVIVGGMTGEASSDDVLLAELYRDEFASLMRVAFLMTGSNEAAEDAVQDTFIRCRSKLGALDHPPSYLRAAVINECRSVLRRSKRRAIEDTETKDLPTDLVELRDALGRLPDRQRAAIILRYFVDIPDTEIAAALSCKPSTVRSLIRRGVTNLKETLQ
jgi:RNA polymerase sigma factor (sigma-70 family)